MTCPIHKAYNTLSDAWRLSGNGRLSAESGWLGSNQRPRGPKPRILSTELHPVLKISLAHFCRSRCAPSQSQSFRIFTTKVCGTLQRYLCAWRDSNSQSRRAYAPKAYVYINSTTDAFYNSHFRILGLCGQYSLILPKSMVTMPKDLWLF